MGRNYIKKIKFIKNGARLTLNFPEKENFYEENPLKPVEISADNVKVLNETINSEIRKKIFGICNYMQ